jgi:D-arginine dehydrogenase
VALSSQPTDTECQARSTEFDIVVIGGGIAGASIAARLAAYATVSLLEMEAQPGYHSTGRSAALFAESYGNEVIQALSRASRPFLLTPPAGFCAAALVKPRAALVIARTVQREALDAFAAAPGRQVDRVSAAQALQLCPILRHEDLSYAIIDHSAADIDVHALHQGYLRLLKVRGGHVTTNAEVIGVERCGGSWSVSTAAGQLRAAIIVNAAGAWAGKLGRLAGAHEIDLQPRRRTAVLIDPPTGAAADTWPLVMDVDEQFYFKPEAGLLLVSPCDETPMPPCDVQPDDTDVAIAVDRFERATTVEVCRVRHRWAGLRSFVRDRSPVVGYDPHARGFFWLAALGGYGIQTAPALSLLAANLVLGRKIGEESNCAGIDPATLAPARL